MCFSTKHCKGNQFAQDTHVPDLFVQNKSHEHLDIKKALTRVVYISYYKSLCVFKYQLDFPVASFTEDNSIFRLVSIQQALWLLNASKSFIHQVNAFSRSFGLVNTWDLVA